MTAPFPQNLPVPPKGKRPLTWDPSKRNGGQMMQEVLSQWRSLGRKPDLWVFGYASLVWRPEFEAEELRAAKVRGYHRKLSMWSRINRGTHERPGLVFALLPGGSCTGVVMRLPHDQVEANMPALWEREMPNPVYDPKWVVAETPKGPVVALAFTLSRKSPSFTGELSEAEYEEIFAKSQGRYGTTLDYARQTLYGLRRHGIEDRALARLLRLAHHL